ncbi:MAG: hypothetical protein WCC95_11040, partial [Candidatus Sulfotelmatobacter sp.]
MRASISSAVKIVLAGSVLLASLGALSQQDNPSSSQPNNASVPAPAASAPVLAGPAGDASGNNVAESNLNIN